MKLIKDKEYEYHCNRKIYILKFEETIHIFKIKKSYHTFYYGDNKGDKLWFDDDDLSIYIREKK